jgi:glycosyltransferase involved in cell wall biosynthesis
VVAAFNFWMMRFLYPHADWISANSENTLNELEEVIGTPSKKRALVRNPVKLHVVERHPTNAVKTILGCGRLIAQKDFHTLIRAVALVRGKRPCRLVIIGDGPERDELLALSTELGFAEDELSLPGFVANTSEYYSAADVFVLPSKWEGLPNVVLEALSYDLPVVATDCSGGTREIFEGLSDAHLVAVGDVENMALKIEQFCEEPPLAGKMQAILSERYDVATIAASYCELAKSK